jgi:lipoteichoic acid synthase
MNFQLVPVIIRALQLSPWLFALAYCLYRPIKSGAPLMIVPFVISISLWFLIASYIVSLVKSRLVWFGLSCLLLVPIMIQIQSFHMSGELLTIMALDNADSAKAIDVNWRQIAPFALLGLCLLLSAAPSPRYMWKPPSYCLAVCFLFFAGLAVQNARNNQIVNSLDLPIVSFVKTLSAAEFESGRVMLNEEDREALELEYRKDIVYSPNPAFNEMLAAVPERPNFLVLFVEGFSARMMGAYGGKRPDLMPNADKFYAESLLFKNYFNHTAATFRGLRGQLTSSFIGVREDGEEGLAFVEKDELTDHSFRGRVVSVPEILADNGYFTAFVTPHDREMNLNTFVKDIGFETVVNGSDIATIQGHDQVPVGDRNLLAFLPEMTAKLKKPYFVGVYNFGTHLFQDSPDVKFGDHSSVVLNRFHNFDVQFGAFLERFKSDPQFANTVLIVTGDHAAYPAPEFTAVEDVRPGFFIDRIPFMIYWNGIKPHQIDVEGRNSLSFAPTLLELARVREARNYFLGCSLFAPGCSLASYVTNINAFYFMTNTGSIRYLSEDKTSEDYSRARSIVERFVQYSGF